MATQLPGFEAELSLRSRGGAYQAAALTRAQPTLVQPAWTLRCSPSCVNYCLKNSPPDYDCWGHCGCY